MPQPSDDHRRIQTGVIGHKGSDLAIVLPMQARELAHWRQQHPDYMYWCGTLLGGCGEPLTNRLYHSKVCHFAHHPHHTCTRAANGENSADHLFMKQALHEWMRNQRLKGTVRLPRGTAPLGEAIDVNLQGGQRRMRFRLRLSSTPSRGQASEEAAEVNGQHVDWIFGMGGPVPTRFLDEDGYVFRIQFETQGAKRCPYLGVQQRSGPITWEPFAEATLTDEGLTTRAVEEVRARRKRSITPPHSKSITDSSPGAASRSQAAKDMNGEELVVALREALELDARWATRPTWKRLGQTVGTDFTRFSADDLRDLLAEVDGPFPPDAPVLSALIRTDAGGPLPYLGNFLEALGLGLPSSASHLKRWSQRETDRAFAKYGVPHALCLRHCHLAQQYLRCLSASQTPLASRHDTEDTRQARERAIVPQLAGGGWSAWLLGGKK